MASHAKNNSGLSPRDSGRGLEDERRQHIKSAEGAMLVLTVTAASMLVLVLVVLSALVSVCG